MLSFFKRKKRRGKGVRGGNVSISAPLQVSRSPELRRKKATNGLEGHNQGQGHSTSDRQSRIVYLERQVLVQQQEISSLKGVIQNLRSSLQVSEKLII